MQLLFKRVINRFLGQTCKIVFCFALSFPSKSLHLKRVSLTNDKRLSLILHNMVAYFRFSAAWLAHSTGERFVPWKIFHIPESRASETGIRNSANDWNPESTFSWKRIRNPLPGIRNPQVESWIWITFTILLHEKFLQFDWLRAVVFQLNLKYLHVKITNVNLLRVVV